MKTKSKIEEKKLTKAELETREKVIKDLKKNKSSLVKRYGKDAEAVMYGRATNIAKKMAESENKNKIKELVRKALMQEIDAEAGADKYEGEQKLSQASAMLSALESKLKSHNWFHYQTDGRVYDEGMAQKKEIQDIVKNLRDMGYGDDAKELYNKYAPYEDGGVNLRMKEAKKSFPDLTGDGKVTKADILKARGVDLDEDLDLGHEDNEPHMLKADLYRIGKYAMELYQMMDEFEGKGEVDFPHWWQSKIINAKSNLVGAKHYLDFEIKEPAIDAVVDRISDVAPEMEIDDESMMENIGKDEILAGKIAKALKDMANKDSSDQNNLKQARIALNKGNMDAAKKIAKPYIDGVNEATRTYWHVIEDVDGEKGHQGVYNTKEEAEKQANRLSDMFSRSFFYVEASNSRKEPVDITLQESKSVAAKLAKQLKSK
jgi:hypothetical protein